MTSEFLESIYGNIKGEGYVELRMLPSPYRNSPKSLFIPYGTKAGQMIDQVVKREQYNVFFGVGLRDSQSGKKDAVMCLPAVWVDVDFKNFLSKQDAKRALWQNSPFGEGKWSNIVETGGGYHGYINLVDPAPREAIATVEAVNKHLATAIGGDPNCCDAARILRLPGTLNAKYDPPRPVQVVYSTDFMVTLDDLVEKLGINEAKETEDNWNATQEGTAGLRNLTEEIEKIFARCRFMQHCVKDAATLPESHWYAAISNLVGYRGSPSVIHAMSRPYPRYSRQETDAKILHALDSSRPITCEKIQSFYKGCPKGGCGVKSPAALPWKTSVTVVSDTENPQDARDREIKQLVAEATPKTGWLARYVEFAQKITDAPKIFHLACGLATLSSAVGRRITATGFGGRPLFANLWQVIVAPSTKYRKSTSIGIAEDMIREIGVPILPQEFSQEMFVQVMSMTPHTTAIWGEFGIPLGNFQKEYMMGIKDLLAHLYDCPDTYERALKSGVLRVNEPYINILAGTNNKWLTASKNFVQDMYGGLMARMLWIPYTSKDFEMDVPNQVDQWERKRLINNLIEYSLMPNTHFAINNVRQIRQELQEELDEVAKASEYTLELSAAFARYQVAALKIAMLLAVADGCETGGTVEIDPMHFMHAVAYVRILRRSIEDLVRSVPLHKDDAMMVEVTSALRALHEKGMPWVTVRDICRHTHRKAQTIKDVLDEAVLIQRVGVKTEGRKVWYQLKWK